MLKGYCKLTVGTHFVIEKSEGGRKILDVVIGYTFGEGAILDLLEVFCESNSRF
jgi:hypothetical protein